MAQRKQRSRPSRRRRNRKNRSTTRVSTGIPLTKRIRGDPPPVNIASTQAVKVVFWIDAVSSGTFNVKLAENALEYNILEMPFTGSNTDSVAYIDPQELMMATLVRAFGYQPNESDPTLTLSEFALQSVSFYGPIAANSIRLGVDFGPGLPGAIATDTGTMASRPCVKVTSPRLYWTPYSFSEADTNTVRIEISGYQLNIGSYPTAKVGQIQCTMHVRRSWFSAAATRATVEKRSNLMAAMEDMVLGEPQTPSSHKNGHHSVGRKGHTNKIHDTMRGP